MYRSRHLHNGFTLIELSIVLVIIGLIAGGVIAGMSLLQNARLQSIQKEARAVIVAANVFKTKYGYLPGDFPQATTAIDPSTTNGNGDGLVDFRFNSGGTSASETTRLWQHLTLSGIYPGSYPGTYANPSLPGTHVPQSQLGQSIGVYFSSYTRKTPFIVGTAYAPLTDNPGNGWHKIEIGRFYRGSLGPHFTRAVVKPLEAALLDQKYDDGIPYSGKFSGGTDPSQSYANCLITTSTPYQYDVTKDMVTCHIEFDYD